MSPEPARQVKARRSPTEEQLAIVAALREVGATRAADTVEEILKRHEEPLEAPPEVQQRR